MKRRIEIRWSEEKGLDLSIMKLATAWEYHETGNSMISLHPTGNRLSAHIRRLHEALRDRNPFRRVGPLSRPTLLYIRSALVCLSVARSDDADDAADYYGGTYHQWP